MDLLVTTHAFNADMAKLLIDLVNLDRGELYTDLRTLPFFIPSHRSHEMLQRWGLIKRSPHNKAHEQYSYYYRTTDEGIAFAHRMSQVPEHIYLLDGEIKGFGQTMVDIQDVIGDQEAYFELIHAGGTHG